MYFELKEEQYLLFDTAQDWESWRELLCEA